MNGGVVVFEGSGGPPDGTLVTVTDTAESEPTVSTDVLDDVFGIWKDRSDLPLDSCEASKVLRERMMRAGNG